MKEGIRKRTKYGAISSIVRAGALLPPEERMAKKREVIRELIRDMGDLVYFYRWGYHRYLHNDDLALVRERAREIVRKERR